MSGIDSLKNRLLQDSEESAKEIETEAAARVREVMDEAKTKVESILEEARSRAEKEGCLRKERIIAGAKLDSRNSVIAAKQETLDRIFKLADERIDGMNNEEYTSFMEKLLFNNIETGSEEVVLSKRDTIRITPGFIERVNQKLAAQGKTGRLRLSSEDRAFSGFILRRGGVEVNCTIASMTRAMREELEAELADILFSQR
jgi:V/A-type H+-transporting ATPase subunit E